MSWGERAKIKELEEELKTLKVKFDELAEMYIEYQDRIREMNERECDRK